MIPIKTRKETVLKMAPKKMQSTNHLINVFRRFSFGLLAALSSRLLLAGTPFSGSCLLLPEDDLA